MVLQTHSSITDRDTYLFLNPGRSEPAGHWLRPEDSESDWSSPRLCQHRPLCPTGPPGRAGNRNSDRPSERTTQVETERCFKAWRKQLISKVLLHLWSLNGTFPHINMIHREKQKRKLHYQLEITNLLCFLVCAVHFGEEISPQLVLQTSKDALFTDQNNYFSMSPKRQIRDMCVLVLIWPSRMLPWGIRRLWGSRSYMLSSPPWLPAHTDQEQTTHSCSAQHSSHCQSKSPPFSVILSQFHQRPRRLFTLLHLTGEHSEWYETTTTSHLIKYKQQFLPEMFGWTQQSRRESQSNSQYDTRYDSICKYYHDTATLP